MHSVWYGRLMARLDEKYADRAKWVRDGGCADYPSYRFDVGYLTGIMDAMQEAADVDAEQVGIPPNASRPSPTSG